MGKLSLKRTERNQELISDYIKTAGTKDGRRISKYTTADLVGKYKISTTRIYQILNRYGVPKRNKN